MCVCLLHDMCTRKKSFWKFAYYTFTRVTRYTLICFIIYALAHMIKQIQTKAYRKLNFSYCYFLAFRYLAWWILIATLANTTLVQRYWNFFYTLQNIHTHSRRTWYRVVYDIRRWWNYLSNSEYLLICLYCTPIMRIIIWVISFRYATEEYDVVQLIHAP